MRVAFDEEQPKLLLTSCLWRFLQTSASFSCENNRKNEYSSLRFIAIVKDVSLSMFSSVVSEFEESSAFLILKNQQHREIFRACLNVKLLPFFIRHTKKK